MRAFRRHTERGSDYSARTQTAPRDRAVAPRRASWGFTEGAPLADALALVRALPPTCKGLASVKAASKLGLFARFDRYWVELRGTILVLIHDDSTLPSPVSADAPGLSSTIAGVVCVLGCAISQTRLNKTPTVRIRKAGAAGVVYLKLATDAEAELWETALKRVVGQRVVGVSDFEFLSPIGRGASGKVFLVRDRTTGEKLALKVIDKRKVFETRNAFRHALDERLALELVDGHPFFSRLRYAFQTRVAFYLAIDFYAGGDLYQYLRTNSGHLAEPQARIVSAEVILALDHLHSLGFVYRDLKPENVLLDENGHVRLADLGLCKLLSPARSMLTSTICGTHTYAAPEMLASRQYGTSVDLWAFGTFLYHILRGRTPYEARDLDQVIKNMNNRHIRFSSTSSPELVGIITKLLDWDPKTRLGCGPGGMQDIRDDPFFADVDFRAVFRRQHNVDGLFQYAIGADGGGGDGGIMTGSTVTMDANANLQSIPGRQRVTSVDDRLENSTQRRHARPVNRSFLERRSSLRQASISSDASCGPRSTLFNTSGQHEQLVCPPASSTEFCDADKSASQFERVASIWDGMVEAAESDDLRNFDMVEWGKVSVDHDEDDASYGDVSLWPISKTRRRLDDGRMIAGFSYCSSDRSFPVPPNL